MTPEVKAIVLLDQQHYLEEHISDPGRYLPFLKRKKILSPAECRSIREQQSCEYQVQKFLELISLKEGGYDVFVEALRTLRVNAHVAVHLRKRVSEVDKLYSQGQLPSEQQQLLTLHDFVRATELGHELARDILSAKQWDLRSALEAARDMGHYHGNVEVARDCHGNVEVAREMGQYNDNMETGCQGAEVEASDSETVSGDALQTSLPNTTSDCEGSNVETQCGIHPIHGILPPPLPPGTDSNISLGENDLCTPENVDPEFGYLPNPPWDHSPASSRDHTPILPSRRTPSTSPPPRGSSSPCSCPHSLGCPPPNSRDCPPPSPPRGSHASSSPRSCPPPNGPSPHHSCLSPQQQKSCSLPPPRPPKPLPPPIPPKQSADSKTVPSVTPAPMPSSTLLGRSSNKPSPKRSLSDRRIPPGSQNVSTPTSNQPASVQGTVSFSRHSSDKAAVRAKLPDKMATGVTLVPDVEPYLMELTDEEAVKTLWQPGLFFIRSCSKNGAVFSLCTTDGVKLLKYHIMGSPQGYHIENDRMPFLSISNLVEYYRRNPILSRTGTKLTVPLRDAEKYNIGNNKPTMLQLQSMRDKNNKEIRTINHTASRWYHVAVALDFEQCTIGILERNHAGDALQGCYNMFAMWVDSRINVTWEVLVDALRRAEFDVLAHNIEVAKIS